MRAKRLGEAITELRGRTPKKISEPAVCSYTGVGTFYNTYYVCTTSVHCPSLHIPELGSRSIDLSRSSHIGARTLRAA